MTINSSSLLLFGVFLLSFLLVKFIFLPTIFPKTKNRIRRIIVGGIFLTGLIYLLVGDWDLLLPALGAFLIYLGLESIRLKRAKEDFRHSIFWLAIWMVIFAFFAYGLPSFVNISSFWVMQFGIVYIKIILILASLLFVTYEASHTIGLLLTPFQQEIQKNLKLIQSVPGLKEGGKWIGILERTLVFIFALSNQFAAIGFLVAAKSILRFGEVKDNSNRMEAEYIIIGTLSSILFALLTAMATVWIIAQVK
jgi:hypothetical protein